MNNNYQLIDPNSIPIIDILNNIANGNINNTNASTNNNTGTNTTTSINTSNSTNANASAKELTLIDKNKMKAYELIPESLFRVEMIYIPCCINNQYITGFVDTGAQINIMNINTVINCGLGDLLDEEHQTQLVGVGTQVSLGKIHYAEIVIGTSIVSCSFTVTTNGPDIILGLNTLLRHKCILDLGNKTLQINNDKVHFLLKKDVVNDESFN